MQKLLKNPKLKELFLYAVVGALTTAVNVGLFWVFTHPVRAALGVAEDAGGYLTAVNILANVVSIAFAFVANKLFVFESRSWERNVALREAVEFGAARGLSLVMDVLLVDLLVLRLGVREMIAKIGVNVLVIVVNYVLSKVWIFRKK